MTYEQAYGKNFSVDDFSVDINLHYLSGKSIFTMRLLVLVILHSIRLLRKLSLCAICGNLYNEGISILGILKVLSHDEKI